MRRRGWWLACLAVLGLGSAQARAEDYLVAHLKLDGPSEERADLEASLRELLGRLRVSVEAGDGPAVARIAITLGPRVCTVSILDRQGTQVVSRQVPRLASAPVTLEAVATVVHSAVEELADQARAPAPVAAPPTSQPPLVALVQPEASSAARPAAVELGAFITGRAFGATAPLVLGGGLGAALRLGSVGPWTPRLGLAASWSGPFEGGGGSAWMQIAVQTVSLRLLGSARLALTPTFSLEGGVGAGADLFVIEGRRTGSLPPGSFDTQRLEASPMLAAQVGVRATITRTTTLTATVGADLDLMPRRYVTLVQGVRDVLFETWSVRPAAQLGFSFDLGAGS
jgi:hypothetical protein